MNVTEKMYRQTGGVLHSKKTEGNCGCAVKARKLLILEGDGGVRVQSRLALKLPEVWAADALRPPATLA